MNFFNEKVPWFNSKNKSRSMFLTHVVGSKNVNYMKEPWCQGEDTLQFAWGPFLSRVVVGCDK
jgi:hypothetical protein